MLVPIIEAEKHLNDLVLRAEAGAEVVICCKLSYVGADFARTDLTGGLHRKMPLRERRTGRASVAGV